MNPPVPLPGTLHLWTFQPESRHARGWHLTADAEGGEALSLLLNDMILEPGSGRRVQLGSATPADIKRICGSRPASLARELILTLNQEQEARWHTDEREGALSLDFGMGKLTLLQTALVRIRKGEGDFAIGDANDACLLNFWPWPES